MLPLGLDGTTRQRMCNRVQPHSSFSNVYEYESEGIRIIENVIEEGNPFFLPFLFI